MPAMFSPCPQGVANPKESGGFEWELSYTLPKQAYGWVAVRVFERDAETGRFGLLIPVLSI